METLFKNISKEKAERLIVDLGAYRKDYKKGDYVANAGERIDHVYYIEKGSIRAENVDYSGNVSIISKVGVGGVFGGAYAFSDEICPLDVLAVEDSRIIVFPAASLFKRVRDNDVGEVFTRNFVGVLAAKSVSLVTKINHVTAKGIRGKITAYLTTESAKNQSDSFTVPFSRQQLADYLSVDRSALSKELSSMKEEGLIDYRKNKFLLLKKSEA